MTTPRVTVPVEPTPKMLAATWDHEIDKSGGIESQNARNARIWAAMLSAAPAPEGVAVPFDREGLIALIMEETTDDIVADGWDRLGKPNVLVQGCRYIRRNAPPSPEGYANPEASAKQFAGFIADRVLKALATREEAPAEAGERDYPAEFEAWWATYRHRNRDVADYPVKKQIAFDAFYHAALRAQPQAREDAQPVAGVDVLFARAAAMRAMLDRLNVRNTNSLTDGQLAAEYQRLHAHPAPDALRVAVEALEEIADTDPDDGTSWFHERANQALAALQAEQKGGA